MAKARERKDHLRARSPSYRWGTKGYSAYLKVFFVSIFMCVGVFLLRYVSKMVVGKEVCSFERAIRGPLKSFFFFSSLARSFSPNAKGFEEAVVFW